MELDLILEDWYDGWLRYMKDSEAPLIYSKWVAISLLSAVLERKVFLQWEKPLYPNFYIVLVGPPGCRKGTAMGPGRIVLNEMNVQIVADATSKEQLTRRLEKAGEGINFEGLDGQIRTYSAMTVFSEEFTVFIGHENKDLMQWMSNWYDCPDKWKYETKHQGINEIEGVWVNLIGGTTPELLKGSMPREGFGGGLNSRIIYVYAEKKQKTVVFPFLNQNANEELKEQLIQDLQKIRLCQGEVIKEQSYLDLWGGWYPQQHNNTLNDDTRMGAYMERRPTHLHKLAIVFNVSRGGALHLTDVDFKRALKLLEETERKMASTFAGVGESQLAGIMNKVLQFVRMRSKVTYSEALKQFYFDADDQTFSLAVATLEKAKLLNLVREEQDFYLVYGAGEDIPLPPPE